MEDLLKCTGYNNPITTYKHIQLDCEAIEPKISLDEYKDITQYKNTEIKVMDLSFNRLMNSLFNIN